MRSLPCCPGIEFPENVNMVIGTDKECFNGEFQGTWNGSGWTGNAGGWTATATLVCPPGAAPTVVLSAQAAVSSDCNLSGGPANVYIGCSPYFEASDTLGMAQSPCCDYPPGEWTWWGLSVFGGTPPIPTSEPPNIPPPCSDVPPASNACCIANFNSGNGPSPGGEIGGDDCDDCGLQGCGTPQVSGPTGTSSDPIRYATGDLIIQQADIVSNGYGLEWGHTRTFSSRSSLIQNFGNGWNWKVSEWPYVVQSPAGNVTVVRDSTTAYFFNPQGSGYVSNFPINKQTLTYIGTTNRFQFTDVDGSTIQFDATSGMFRQQVDPAGNITQVTALTSNGFNFATIQRTTTILGLTTVEQFSYTYTSLADLTLVESITLQRQVNGGSWTNIGQASYTYYSDSDTGGAQGDLETVTTQTWNNSTWESTSTTYYRYYCSNSSSGSSSSSSSSSGGTAYQPVEKATKVGVTIKLTRDLTFITNRLTPVEKMVMEEGCCF